MQDIIKIDGLYKSFKEVKAVQNLSFKVKKGQLFAFLGVNGAGKSTTISIMCGQLKKDNGKIFINGIDLDENIDKIKRDLGVVFQSSVLDQQLTVKENLQTRAVLYGIFGDEFEKRFAYLAKTLDFEDFINRMAGSEMNKRSIEVLIKSGAFDSIFPNRRVLLLNFEPMVDAAQKDALGKAADQVSFFGEEEMAPALKPLFKDSAEDFSFLEKLSFENELAGMYLSGHPLNEYLLSAVGFSDTDIYAINDGRVEDGAKVNICGVISGISAKRTKRGLLICTMSFADLYDSIELTAFENTYTKYSSLFAEGNAICVTAQVKKHNDDVSLMLLGVFEASKYKLPEKCTLYVKVADASEMKNVKSILDSDKGSTPVCIYIEESDTALKSDSDHGVKMSAQLVRNLSDLLGADNVKIR